MSKLQDLSALLRNESQWPEGFAWDYSDTSTCALGLAYASGILDETHKATTNPTEVFGLPWREFEAIFFGHPCSDYDVETVDDITPEMVADEIDRQLKRMPVATVFVDLRKLDAMVDEAIGRSVAREQRRLDQIMAGLPIAGVHFTPVFSFEVNGLPVDALPPNPPRMQVRGRFRYAA